MKGLGEKGQGKKTIGIVSKNLEIKIKSIPSIIILETKVTHDAKQATIRLVGLKSNAEYYKYEDYLDHYEVIITDANGDVSFEQNTESDHVVFIQSKKSAARCI